MNQETARQDFIDNVFIVAKEKEKEKLEQYGRCEDCNEQNTYTRFGDRNWCSTCNAGHFQKDFNKWTSENKEIDYFIQNSQIHAWRNYFVLEWYPWEIFTEIEEIGKGGYGTVFRAKTKVQRIEEWNYKKNEWSRYEYISYVALKTIGHSESLSRDFLNEVFIDLLYIIDKYIILTLHV